VDKKRTPPPPPPKGEECKLPAQQAAPPPYPSPIGRGVNTVIPLLLDKWWYANNILIRGGTEVR